MHMGRVGYGQIFDVHVLIPQPRKLKKMLALRIVDEAADGVVRATEVASGFEFEVGHQARLRTAYVCVIAEFVLHSAEEDAARVHVWLRDKAASLLALI